MLARLLNESFIPMPLRRRGKVIRAGHRFKRVSRVKKFMAVQRVAKPSRALALLTLPFLFHRDMIVPVKRSYRRRDRGVGIPVTPGSSIPLGVKRERTVLREAINRSPVTRISPRALSVPVAISARSATVCMQRKERREVLFARKGAGSGVSPNPKRRRTEKSKVRCV